MRTLFDRKSSSQSKFGRPCRSSQIISSRTAGQVVAMQRTSWPARGYPPYCRQVGYKVSPPYLSAFDFLYSLNYVQLKNNANLNSIFCLIQTIDFIFLPAYSLIMWFMRSPKNFVKIPILKI